MRLKRRADFLRVAGFRHKWAAPGLILQAAPSPGGDGTGSGSDGAPSGVVRVGFTVSRKVGGAVERNRARRRLKVAADAVLLPKARSGFDYVLIGRRETIRRPFAALLGDLDDALRHVHAPDRGTRTKRGPDQARDG